MAKVNISDDFGLGMAIDIEGNCRFYDLLRFRKMAKINGNNVRVDGEINSLTKFRLLDNVCAEMTQDAFLGIIQSPKILKDEEADAEARAALQKANEELIAANEAKAAGKGGKGGGAPVEEVEPETMLDDT